LVQQFGAKVLQFGNSIFFQNLAQDSEKGYLGMRGVTTTGLGVGTEDRFGDGFSGTWQVAVPAADDGTNGISCIRYGDKVRLENTHLGDKIYFLTISGSNVDAQVSGQAGHHWRIMQRGLSGLGCIKFGRPVMLQSWNWAADDPSGGYLAQDSETALGWSVQTHATSADFQGFWTFIAAEFPAAPDRPLMENEGGSHLKVTWNIPDSQFPVTDSLVAIREVGKADWHYVDAGKGNRLVPTRNDLKFKGIPAPNSFVSIPCAPLNKKYRAAVALKNDLGWGGWSVASKTVELQVDKTLVFDGFDNTAVNGFYELMVPTDLGEYLPSYIPYRSATHMIYKEGSTWNVIDLAQKDQVLSKSSTPKIAWTTCDITSRSCPRGQWHEGTSAGGHSSSGHMKISLSRKLQAVGFEEKMLNSKFARMTASYLATHGYKPATIPWVSTTHLLYKTSRENVGAVWQIVEKAQMADVLQNGATTWVAWT